MGVITRYFTQEQKARHEARPVRPSGAQQLALMQEFHSFVAGLPGASLIEGKFLVYSPQHIGLLLKNVNRVRAPSRHRSARHSDSPHFQCTTPLHARRLVTEFLREYPRYTLLIEVSGRVTRPPNPAHITHEVVVVCWRPGGGTQGPIAMRQFDPNPLRLVRCMESVLVLRRSLAGFGSESVIELLVGRPHPDVCMSRCVHFISRVMDGMIDPRTMFSPAYYHCSQQKIFGSYRHSARLAGQAREAVNADQGN